MKLVLFDLDNTLLAGDSDFEWAQFLIDKGVLDREVYEAQNQVFYDQYKDGTLDIHAFLDFQLRPLARHDRAQLDAWHREYMETRLKPMIAPKAQRLILQHLSDADLVAIITATNSFVTRPIADLLGVEHLIATEPELTGDQYTGKVSGIPCFREHKVTRLEMWLSERGLLWEDIDSSWFYSDSLNDLPLLQKVDFPVAVDPDSTLQAHAQNAGWPIISLR
ncbi:MAG: HAD family hydrolase [Thiobacillaceae bacterium]|jgi:HAD superfamily hydrolase (TIGR01490 family)